MISREKAQKYGVRLTVVCLRHRWAVPSLLIVHDRNDLPFVKPAALHPSAHYCGGLHQNLEES